VRPHDPVKERVVGSTRLVLGRRPRRRVAHWPRR
jgi:hypothetical protein